MKRLFAGLTPFPSSRRGSADDLGHSCVGYNSPAGVSPVEIRTPNIDGLAHLGAILGRHCQCCASLSRHLDPVPRPRAPPPPRGAHPRTRTHLGPRALISGCRCVKPSTISLRTAGDHGALELARGLGRRRDGGLGPKLQRPQNNPIEHAHPTTPITSSSDT